MSNEPTPWLLGKGKGWMEGSRLSHRHRAEHLILELLSTLHLGCADPHETVMSKLATLLSRSLTYSFPLDLLASVAGSF